MVTIEFLLQLQKELVQDTGLAVECIDTGKLEAALMRVENRVQYGLISHPVEIAAWYAAAIARGHCFPDANKRTAYMTLLVFLENNNYSFPMDHAAELEDKIVELAADKITTDALSNWLLSILEENN